MPDASQQCHFSGASILHRTTGQTALILGQLVHRFSGEGVVPSRGVLVRPHGGGDQSPTAPADLESRQDTGAPHAA